MSDLDKYLKLMRSKKIDQELKDNHKTIEEIGSEIKDLEKQILNFNDISQNIQSKLERLKDLAKDKASPFLQEWIQACTEDFKDKIGHIEELKSKLAYYQNRILHRTEKN